MEENDTDVVRDLRAFSAERRARLLGLKWVMSIAQCSSKYLDAPFF